MVCRQPFLPERFCTAVFICGMLDWKIEWHDLLCGCNVQIWCNVDRFYIALFSALEQTCCACVWFYMYEWLAFYSKFLNILWSGVLTELTCGTAAFSAWSVYTIQPCTMSLHAQPCTQGVCMFSCNLPPALLAEWLGSFMCYFGNGGGGGGGGWNRYRNKS